MNRWTRNTSKHRADFANNLGESVLVEQDGIRLDDGDNKTSYSNGDLTVTTHRIYWSSKVQPEMVLELSLVVLVEEESSGGFMKSEKLVLHLSLPPPNPPAPSVVESSSFNHIRLVFKSGGMKLVSTKLQEALAMRKWEQLAPVRKPPAARQIRSGIGGIEKNLANKARNTNVQISNAFQDLDALMEMAKPMVSLANTLSKKIRDKQGELSEDETVRFKSYLMSLGISDPVTKESHGSGQAYYLNLAKELHKVLEKPVRESGGMMTLTDAYVRINRARGLELISPEDLLNACECLNSANSSLSLYTFPSTGVKVLQSSSFQSEEIAKQTTDSVESSGSLTPEELSRMAGIAIVLAKERLLAAEDLGALCRDDTVEGLRFYPNLFLKA